MCFVVCYSCLRTFKKYGVKRTCRSALRTVGLRGILVLWLVVLSALGPLAIRMVSGNPETEGGVHRLPLLPVTLSFLIETSKLLVLGVVMVGRAVFTDWRPRALKAKSWLYVGIPAVLYVANNSIKLLAQEYLDPTSYLLLNQLSILTTAFLFRLIMRRKLTWLQYVALALLVAGLALSKLGAFLEHGSEAAHQVLVLGLVLSLIGACTASCADVGVEYCFKRLDEGLMEQNLGLYLMGAVLNLVTLVAVYHDKGRLYEEYARVVFLRSGWLIVGIAVVSGFTIALALAYLNNITKIFTSAGGIVLVAVLEVFIFGHKVNSAVVMGIIVVCLAIALYFHQRDAAALLNRKPSEEKEHKADLVPVPLVEIEEL